MRNVQNMSIVVKKHFMCLAQASVQGKEMSPTSVKAVMNETTKESFQKEKKKRFQ